MKKIFIIILLGIISFCCKGQEVNEDDYLVIDENFYEYEKLDEMVNNDKINLILKPLYVIYNYDKHEKQIEPCSESDYLVIKKGKIQCQIGDNFLFNFSDDFKIDHKYMTSCRSKDTTWNSIYFSSIKNLEDTIFNPNNSDDYWCVYFDKDMNYLVKKHIINCHKDNKDITGYSIIFDYDVVNEYIICYIRSIGIDKDYKYKEKMVGDITLLFKKSDLNVLGNYPFLPYLYF